MGGWGGFRVERGEGERKGVVEWEGVRGRVCEGFG